MRADLDAGIQERDRVRGAADTGVRLSVTVKTTGPLSAVRPAIIFFEKLLSFLAKSQNASVIFVPASRSSHTFGHKNHSVFRFLSRTANVFLQKMDALLPEAK